jgi:hypothetical protein
MVTLRGDGSCASDRDTASVDCTSARGRESKKHLGDRVDSRRREEEHDWSSDSQVLTTGEHVDNNGGESGKTGVRKYKGRAK